MDADIDLMRDVYMTDSQRQAYNRILARALSPPASAGEGFVCVPRVALQTEARRLRYRADECGLPGRTDAGIQMVATAKQLEAWAAAPTPPATAQEDGRGALLAQVLAFLLDDAAAMSYQTLGQYRTAAAAMLTSPDSGKEG